MLLNIFLDILVDHFPHWMLLCCTLSVVSKHTIYIVCPVEHVVLAFFSQGDKFICLLEVLSFSLGAVLEYP